MSILFIKAICHAKWRCELHPSFHLHLYLRHCHCWWCHHLYCYDYSDQQPPYVSSVYIRFNFSSSFHPPLTQNILTQYQSSLLIIDFDLCHLLFIVYLLPKIMCPLLYLCPHLYHHEGRNIGRFCPLCLSHLQPDNLPTVIWRWCLFSTSAVILTTGRGSCHLLPHRQKDLASWHTPPLSPRLHLIYNHVFDFFGWSNLLRHVWIPGCHLLLVYRSVLTTETVNGTTRKLDQM